MHQSLQKPITGGRFIPMSRCASPSTNSDVPPTQPYLPARGIMHAYGHSFEVMPGAKRWNQPCALRNNSFHHQDLPDEIRHHFFFFQIMNNAMTRG